MSRARIIAVPGGPEEWHELVIGAPLRASMPSDHHGPVVLRLNGQFLLRKDWPEVVEDDLEVEWLIDQPGGKEDLRTVLQIAVVVAAIVAPTFAPYLAAVSVAYNLLVPPTIPDQPAPGEAVYNAALAGNRARLDDPIWRVCGLDNITPPFAAQPYLEFDSNGDQYYYAIFAVSYGPLDLLAAFVGKTPIGNLTDVIRKDLLDPGVQPSLALANVVTSSEVSGLEMKPGRYVPGGAGYVACQPMRTCKSIGWDIIAPQGLGRVPTEDLPLATVTVRWQVEYREIDDSGRPLGDFQIIATEERTLSTQTPFRYSGKADLPTPARVEVRIARIDPGDSDANARQQLEWAGLRGYLQDAAPLNQYVTHYEVVLRASQQLSAQSQTDFHLIVYGKTRTWSVESGWSTAQGNFGDYAASRNPAWWLADLWSDPIWGEGLPDERIDLAGLLDLATLWEQRQDRFDFTFTSRLDAWAASQMIATAGRARVFRRYGVRTLARDGLATMGEKAFTPRNTMGAMPMAETLPRASDPDGVVIEYTSNVTWDVAQIECPCPGVDVITRPIFTRLDGVKGYHHALREGLYHAADMALRQRTVSCQTEMQAVLAAFLLPVRWMPQTINYGQTGDVAFWDADTLAMGLTEQADFTRGALYLTLQRDDGSLTDPVLVLPGATVWDVVLPDVPDFTLVLNDATRERPMFLLGTMADVQIVKISAIKSAGQSSVGAQYFNIEGVVDDPVVHMVDNPYLPGPDDIQDPVVVPSDPGQSGTVLIVNLTPTVDQYAQASSFNTGGVGAGPSQFVFKNDGSVRRIAVSDGNVTPPRMWMLFGLVDTSVAALYEIRFTYRPDYYPLSFYYAHSYAYGAVNGPPNTDGPLDTWLSLDVDRTIGLTTVSPTDGPNVIAPVLVEIRKIGAAAVSAQGFFILHAQYLGSG